MSREEKEVGDDGRFRSCAVHKQGEGATEQRGVARATFVSLRHPIKVDHLPRRSMPWLSHASRSISTSDHGTPLS